MAEELTTEVQTPQQTTAIAEASKNPFAIFDRDFGAGATVDNFAGTPDQRMKLASMALGGAAEPGGELVGEVFEFSNWFIQHVQLENEKTGELTDCPRVVLIDPAGNAIQFVSFGVYQSLRIILSYTGLGKIDPPRRVKICQRKTRKGWKVMYLDPVTD